VEAGNGFGLKLQAIECGSGKTIAAVSGEAPSRAQVVRTVGLETVELRSKLGEPAASVARFNNPLDTATSSSPDALQMLLEGHKRHLVSYFRGAASYYQRAVGVDPSFADAIKILKRTKPYDFAYPDSLQSLYPAYMRGLAYLRMGEASLARIEFQELLDHPGLVEMNVIGALSRLQLARANQIER
jgi:hypothetical protein